MSIAAPQITDDTAPAIGLINVTPSDSTDLGATSYVRALWVGGAGDVSVVMADGTTGTFTAVPAGRWMPLRVRQVRATGTTATNIVAVY